MSTETHVNALVEDMEAAYKEAATALAKFYDKVQLVKQRLTGVVNTAEEEVNSPEAKALEAGAEEEIDKAEGEDKPDTASKKS